MKNSGEQHDKDGQFAGAASGLVTRTAAKSAKKKSNRK